MSAKETNSKLEPNTSHIHRRRLTDDFKKKIVERRLILVIAPPGYGKTTFLADAAGAVELPVCSVSLSNTTDEVGALDTALRRGLVKRFRRLKDVLSPRVRPPVSEAELDGEDIGRALAENVPEDHLLVIDQVERLVGDTQAIDYLNDLYHSLPAQCTLVLAGRSMPDLNIASDLAANRVKHYGAVELAFDYEEMVELVQSHVGEDLNEEVLAELYEQTEGWPTGVLLSELVQPLSGLIGPEVSLIDQYFIENAYQELPEGLQDFLLGSSYFPVINSELCDASLGRNDSHQAISRLLSFGVFLFKEGYYPEPFYRLQVQYRQFLQRRARDTGQGSREEVVQRATEWYEEHHLPEYAFKLAIELGNDEKAAEIAEKNSGQLYVDGNHDLIGKWSDLLFARQACAPKTFQFYALYHSHVGNISKADSWYAKAENCIDKNPDPEVSNRILNGRFLINRDVASTHDPATILEEMEELLPKLGLNEKARYLSALMEYQYTYLRRHDDALRTFELLEEIATPANLQRALHTKGIILVLKGELNEAALAFNSALDISEENNLRRTKIEAYLNLGTIAQYQGRYFEANMRYRQALSLSRRIKSSHLERWSLMSIGDLLTDLSILELAENFYKDALNLGTAGTDEGRVGPIKAALGRCLRLAGKSDQAQLLLSELSINPFYWYYNVDLGIELAYIKYPHAPQMRRKYLNTLATKFGDTAFGQIQLKIHEQICCLESGNESRADKMFQEICLLLTKYNFHNLLAVEASRNNILENYIRTRQTNISKETMKLVEEIIRSRNSFYLTSEYRNNSESKFVSLGNIEVRGLHGRKGKLRPVHLETLFYILDKKAISSEELASDLWGNLPPDDQLANLHVAIYQIRKEVGQNAIKTISGGYEASLDSLNRYDVNLFEDVFRRVQSPSGTTRIFHGSIEEGIALYKGDFLPGFYSNWIISRRRHLEDKYHRLLVQYSESAVRQKVPEIALGRLRDAVNKNPLEASLAEAYLELLIEMEKIQDAIVFFRRHEKLLAEELHLHPSKKMIILLKKAVSIQAIEDPRIGPFIGY